GVRLALRRVPRGPVRHRDMARARHGTRARAAARGAAPLQGARRSGRDGPVTGPLPHGSVVAVVVTRHRREQLVDSLAAMAKQTQQIAHLVVVDNGPDEPSRDVVEACGIPATWLPSWRNLGGAGGFALGM